ncbi:MAG TPA: PA14 domain-containing protein [Tepidisphaeraceae bacterium]
MSRALVERVTSGQRSVHAQPSRRRSRRLPRAVSHAVESLEGRFLLSGSLTVTPTTPLVGDTNLSAEGNLDWVHFGYPASPTKIHQKAGVTGPRLADFTTIGSATPVAASTSGKTFTWTDATAPAPTVLTGPGDAIIEVDGQNDGDVDAGPPPAAETVDHMFDGLEQKYLNFLDLNSGAIVTPQANGGNGTVVNGIRLFTANDAVERDPASYVLEGTNDNPDDAAAVWTQISAGPLALPDGRNAGGNIAINPADPNQPNQALFFTNTTSYKSYRVTFPTLKNAGAANSMQIGEVQLLNQPPTENATATADAKAVTGSGNGFHLTAPASPILRRLKVYVAVDTGAGQLTATLSDGSVAPVTQTLTDNNAAGPTIAVYTIDFKSNTDNQTLSIDWVSQSGAKVFLSAATWIGGGLLNVTPTTPATGDTNLTSEGNLDWIHWGYSNDATKLHQKSNVVGPRISNFTVTGGGTAAAGNTPGKTFSWTDATPPPAVVITQPGDAIIEVDGQNDGDANAGPPPAAESVDHMFDGFGQKYLNFLDLNSGAIVTPQANGGNGSIVNGIRLFTANDAPERDPASYLIEGTNDNPADAAAVWTQISAGDLALPTARNAGGQIAINPATQANQTVFFTNATTYKSFRVTFPTLRNAGAANSMQIGEVQLLQQPPPENAAATPNGVTLPGGQGFHFTAPASSNVRRLKVYVAVDGGAGTLTATLSDGSQAPVVQTLLDTNAAGATTAIYTIDYQAASDNQSIAVDWAGAPGATATLSAASWIEFQLPSAPVGVTATATGKGRMNVSWTDTSTNETGFRIERATSQGGPFTPIFTAGPGVQQYIDSGLNDNTAYFYRVSALNLAGAAAAVGNPATATTATIGATGVSARYYQDTDPTVHLDPNNRVVNRIDPNIGTDWGTGSPDAIVPVDRFSGQWEGTYIADYSGPTTFSTDTDDGGRFFIDLNGNGSYDYDPVAAGTTTPNGELVVNSWVDQGLGIDNVNNGRGRVVNLVAGQRYNIRFQYYENGGGAAAFLYVQGPAGTQQFVIPTESFVPLPPVAPKVIGQPDVDRQLPPGVAYTPAQHLVIHFSEEVGPVDPGNIIITHLGGAGEIYSGFGQLQWAYDGQTNSGVLTFPGIGAQALPDGNYKLQLVAAGFPDADGTPLDGNGDGTAGDDYITNFYIFTGDTQTAYDGTAKPDRKIDFSDYQRLELNYGKSAATGARVSAGEGDFDHSGTVDDLDVAYFFAHVGQTAPAPTPVAAATPATAPSKPAPAKKPAPAPAPKAVTKAAKPVVTPPPAASKFATKRITKSVKDLLG